MTPEQIEAVFTVAGLLSVPVAVGTTLAVLFYQLKKHIAEYTIVATAQAGINANTRIMLGETHTGLHEQRKYIDDLTRVLNRHRGDIEVLDSRTNSHADSLGKQCLGITAAQQEIAQLHEVVHAAVEAATAAQGFYDRTIKREFVSEDELKLLGKALAKWAHQGRLN